MDNLESELAAQGLAVWSAFTHFCEREMGLEADKVLEALASPLAERVRGFMELAERLQVVPDTESVEEYRALMEEAWARVLEKE